MKKLLILSMVWFCCSSFTIDIDKVMGKAEAGNVKAQYQVGWYYANTQRDYAKAIMWLKKSAEEYAPAQYYLGYCYFYGLGVEKDMKQAAYWYEKASLSNKKDIRREAKTMLRVLSINN